MGTNHQFYASIAQRIECPATNREAGGLNPSGRAPTGLLAQWQSVGLSIRVSGVQFPDRPPNRRNNSANRVCASYAQCRQFESGLRHQRTPTSSILQMPTRCISFPNTSLRARHAVLCPGQLSPETRNAENVSVQALQSPPIGGVGI